MGQVGLLRVPRSPLSVLPAEAVVGPPVLVEDPVRRVTRGAGTIHPYSLILPNRVVSFSLEAACLDPSFHGQGCGNYSENVSNSEKHYLHIENGSMNSEERGGS